MQYEIDPGVCPKGVKIEDDEMAAVSIHRHEFHGEWNYTIKPDTLNRRESL